MNNQIRLLKYLKKIKADIKEKNINNMFSNLHFADEEEFCDFLSDLEKEKFIKWTDGRPRKVWEGGNIIGSSIDKSAPMNYRAKITIEGMKFLRDDNFKFYTKTTAVGATITALLAILVSVYFGISSNDKENRIVSLDNKLKLQSDSINYLREELKEAKKLLLLQQNRLELQSRTDRIKDTSTNSKVRRTHD